MWKFSTYKLPSYLGFNCIFAIVSPYSNVRSHLFNHPAKLFPRILQLLRHNTLLRAPFPLFFIAHLPNCLLIKYFVTHLNFSFPPSE